MLAADQWTAIEEGLGAAWDTARLSFSAEEARSRPGERGGPRAPRARPGRDRAPLRGREARRRPAEAPEPPGTARREADLGHARRSSRRRHPRRHRARRRTGGRVASSGAGLAEAWDREVAKLAPGWRDLLCELELDSSDYVPRAALLGAPLNPTRRTGCARAPLPGLGRQRLRHLAGHDAALPRAHGRGGDHGARHRAARPRGHGPSGDAGPGVAHRRQVRLTVERDPRER